MFDCAVQFMVQLIDFIPGLIALTILFEFLGSFFFGK